MNEVAAALYSTLSGGTALVSQLSGTASIYQAQAPEGAALPYVVFNKQAGGPVYQYPDDARDLTYFVRAYAAGDNGAKVAGAIDGAIENLLHRKNIVITGWNTVQCYRETDLEQVETRPNGLKVYMAGAFYRIRIV